MSIAIDSTETYMVNNMTYEDYLAHHGILGMRWGKRNGPPYPLNEHQMSVAEKRKNEVSEFASKVKITKLKEREKIRKTKVKEREQIRQNKVAEKEQIRQNKVEEKEMLRQEQVADQEARDRYVRGRKYVRNAVLALGVMTVTVIAGKKLYDRKVAAKTAKEAAKVAVKETKQAAKLESVKKAYDIASERAAINRIARENAAWGSRQKSAEDFILKKGLTSVLKIKGH